MPKSWSKSQERQYDAIRKSLSTKVSQKKAKQIAAATVNKTASKKKK